MGQIRDKKFVTLLQGSEMSAGWHSRNLISGRNCSRIAAHTVWVCALMVSGAEINDGDLSSFHGRAAYTSA